MSSTTPKGGAAQALALAWSLGWPITAGLLAGYWLDTRLGTAPWLALALAMLAMVIVVMRIISSLEREREGR